MAIENFELNLVRDVFRNYPNHIIETHFNYFNPLVKYTILKSVILIGVLNAEFIFIYTVMYISIFMLN